ncbi:MAG: fused MFS/spermidine synthase [Verrucomicrobiota bacterium]
MRLPPVNTPATSARLRLDLGLCCCVSGFASLVFEVLWSRQFVTVFGNSSYAISTVLCAYMAGLGLGGIFGGRLADRVSRPLSAYAIAQAVTACWALAIPLLLGGLRDAAPDIRLLAPDSAAICTATRFLLAFALLVAPCFFMGATMPLLVRALAADTSFIGKHIGILYGWNTLGAAAGCLAAGFRLIETLGLHETNLLAAGCCALVAVAAFLLNKLQPPAPAATPATPAGPESPPPVLPASALLGISFLNGFTALAAEVLWLRHLGLLNYTPYVFPTVLCVCLAGIGAGSWASRWIPTRPPRAARSLGYIQSLSGFFLAAAFAAGARIFSAGPPRPLDLAGMACLTILPPAFLMGLAFPVLGQLRAAGQLQPGRRFGGLLGANTAGTALGAVAPIFFLIPALGIRGSLLLLAAATLLSGAALLLRARARVPAAAAALAAACLPLLAPPNLERSVFLATSFNLARHNDITFCKEGRTGTATITRDRINSCRSLYVNGICEVPLLYGDLLCFKMIGDLGPMLHPNPHDVLMVCLGGGIASGAATQIPEVQSLTVVDIESSVADAAREFAAENHDLLNNPKVRLVIDDGRNYILMSKRRWPVIISDSSHPKSADSWVLYTREFFEVVRDHLTPDGIFVQWVPFHDLRSAEFQIILRTFQSAFPHTSLWTTLGFSEQGVLTPYALLVATPEPLTIRVPQLRGRLATESVRQDLALRPRHGRRLPRRVRLRRGNPPRLDRKRPREHRRPPAHPVPYRLHRRPADGCRRTGRPARGCLALPLRRRGVSRFDFAARGAGPSRPGPLPRFPGTTRRSHQPPAFRHPLRPDAGIAEIRRRLQRRTGQTLLEFPRRPPRPRAPRRIPALRPARTGRPDLPARAGTGSGQRRCLA